MQILKLLPLYLDLINIYLSTRILVLDGEFVGSTLCIALGPISLGFTSQWSKPKGHRTTGALATYSLIFKIVSQ